MALSCPGSTHTRGQEAAPSRPQSRLSSPGEVTLSQPLEGRKWKVPQHQEPLSPQEGFLLLQVRGGACHCREATAEGPPLSVQPGAGRRAGLSRSFSEKQLSSDSVGSTFLHDEGGIPVFTLNNVFLCLNRTHDVLNSSRFLAPYCSSSGTGTGLRPLAEARTQGWSGHLLRLEFPLGGWKSGSAPGRGVWSGCSSTLG